MQRDAVVMGPAFFQGLDLLFLPARLKATVTQGASIPGYFTQCAQKPSATGAGDNRFFTGVVKALGLALRLYQFPILPLIDGPVKGIIQVGTRAGIAAGASVELSGIGDFSRQQGSAVGASDHKSTQRVNPGGAKAGGLQSQDAEARSSSPSTASPRQPRRWRGRRRTRIRSPPAFAPLGSVIVS
jgi:hypothetical protein